MKARMSVIAKKIVVVVKRMKIVLRARLATKMNVYHGGTYVQLWESINVLNRKRATVMESGSMTTGPKD